MTVRVATVMIALMALAACKGGDTAASGNAAAPAAPVAAAKAPAGQNWTETVVKTPEGGYRMGNPDAAIKLVEYGSRTCPVCGEFGRTGMKPLEEKYVASGKISYEFREYLVHGQPDVPASLLGRCGGAAPFFPLLEQMYAQQGPIEEKLGAPEGQALFQKMQSAPPAQAASAWADYLGYVDFVKQRGIPDAKAKACLADARDLGEITKMMQEGDSKGVTGTPSFFINGNKVEAITWDQLEPALKAAGA